jgi:hypothetical protein
LQGWPDVQALVVIRCGDQPLRLFLIAAADDTAFWSLTPALPIRTSSHQKPPSLLRNILIFHNRGIPSCTQGALFDKSGPPYQRGGTELTWNSFARTARRQTSCPALGLGCTRSKVIIVTPSGARLALRLVSSGRALASCRRP